MKRIVLLYFCLSSVFSYAQQEGVLKGRVFDKKNNEPVPFAHIVIWNTSVGTTSDIDGNYEIKGILPGYIEIRVSSVGFKPYVSEAIFITNARPAYFEVQLEEESVQIDELVVKASAFRKKFRKSTFAQANKYRRD